MAESNGDKRWWQKTASKVIVLVAMALTAPITGYLTGGAGAQDTSSTAAEAVKTDLKDDIAILETGLRRDIERIEVKVDTNSGGIVANSLRQATVVANQATAKEERRALQSTVNNIEIMLKILVAKDSSGNP